MARIGTRTMARKALDVHGESLDYGETRTEGWTCIGAGSFRSAYLAPDGVVYKVEEESYDDGYTNTHESKMAKRLRAIRWEHVRIPDTTLYSVGGDSPVLAMEYVDGVMGRDSIPTAHREARQEMFEKGKLCDMHGDNFLFQGDTLVPVDMGSPVANGTGWLCSDRRVLSAGNGDVGS